MTLTRTSTESLWDVALAAGSPEAIAGLLKSYPDAGTRTEYEVRAASNVDAAVRIVTPPARVAEAKKLHEGLHLQTAWDVALEIGGSADTIAHLLRVDASDGGAQLVQRPGHIENEAMRTRMAIIKPASRTPLTGQPWVTPGGEDWTTPDGQSWWTP